MHHKKITLAAINTSQFHDKLLCKTQQISEVHFLIHGFTSDFCCLFTYVIFGIRYCTEQEIVCSVNLYAFIINGSTLINCRAS